MIRSHFCDLSKLDDACAAVLGDSDLEASFFHDRRPSKHIKGLLGALRSGLCAVVEYPYVDKVYRDSYYSYFASKSTPYPRNAIRVSLFERHMQKWMFHSTDGQQWLRTNFLGFFVLRPTPATHILGRSCIDPRAMKALDMRACMTSLDVSVYNVKMKARGFPHSSQDGETITCAETSLWALVEYFSSRYPEYHPVLPSDIHQILSGMSVERQMPSKGLEMSSISYALKALGFAPRIYGVGEFKKNVFMDLVDIYVESGIPVLTGISNAKHGGRTDHAFLTIGKQNSSKAQNGTKLGTMKGRKIFDFPNAQRLVTVDDSLPPYTTLDVKNHAAHYAAIDGDNEWANCEIDAVIVPLYPKIYLEAFEARQYAVEHIKESWLFQGLRNHLSVRLFLASSRSYRDYLMQLEGPGEEVQDALLSVEMPKFIWVAELYTCDHRGRLSNAENAQGLLIVDATEPNTEHDLALILGAWGNRLLFREDGSLKEVKDVTSRPFKGFNNLRTQ